MPKTTDKKLEISNTLTDKNNSYRRQKKASESSANKIGVIINYCVSVVNIFETDLIVSHKFRSQNIYNFSYKKNLTIFIAEGQVLCAGQ